MHIGFTKPDGPFRDAHPPVAFVTKSRKKNGMDTRGICSLPNSCPLPQREPCVVCARYRDSMVHRRVHTVGEPTQRRTRKYQDVMFAHLHLVSQLPAEGGEREKEREESLPSQSGAIHSSVSES